MIPIISASDARALEQLLSRSQLGMEEQRRSCVEILDQVRRRGDEALRDYTERFDGVRVVDFRVDPEEIEQAWRGVDPEFRQTLLRAADNIRAFHERQKQQTWMDVQPGRMLGQMIRPLAAVGVYVPGGTAAYPSSVLMNVLPAKVAGVPRIAMVTPPMPDGRIYPMTLAAAKAAGVDEVYRVGGAQAVGALAYGTPSIPRVDKIVGPGNIYVALAKREVYGQVGIDMVAGPSEVVVVADGSANPAFVAADLLSQAEHDRLSAAILIAVGREVAEAVRAEVLRQVELLPRKEIALASLANHGAAVVAQDRAEAIMVANRIAPEHLELAVEEPFALLGAVRNAGAVFLGHYAPEPLGDYFAGPNHVLPTSGTARFFSPLSVEDFVKRTSVLYYDRASLLEALPDISRFARTEGLTAHARSVELRGEVEA